MKPGTGQAPSRQKTMPVSEDMTAMTAISMAKPRGRSERCGMSTAEKMSGSAAGALAELNLAKLLAHLV
jgi:hypothetical protein